MLMETQILAFSETLKVTEGKTKAESVASLIWFLPYSPDLLLSTRFPGAKVSFLSRALGVTCTRRYVHSALRVGSWVCLQRTGKRVPLRRQVTRSEGGTSVWSWEKKGHWGSNTGIWCSLAFLSIHVFLPPPGHHRCSTNTWGIKPDGLYTFYFGYFSLYQNRVNGVSLGK